MSLKSRRRKLGKKRMEEERELDMQDAQGKGLPSNPLLCNLSHKLQIIPQEAIKHYAQGITVNGPTVSIQSSTYRRQQSCNINSTTSKLRQPVQTNRNKVYWKHPTVPWPTLLRTTAAARERLGQFQSC